MKLTINGTAQDIPKALTVRDLVVFLGRGEVAVDPNRALVHFVGGG